MNLLFPVAAGKGFVNLALNCSAIYAMRHHTYKSLPGILKSKLLNIFYIVVTFTIRIGPWGVKALDTTNGAEGVFGPFSVELVTCKLVGARNQAEVCIRNDEVIILLFHTNGTTKSNKNLFNTFTHMTCLSNSLALDYDHLLRSHDLKFDRTTMTRAQMLYKIFCHH